MRLEHLLSGGACTWTLFFICVHCSGVIMRSDFAGFLFTAIFFCDKLETMVRPGADFSWFFFSFE